MALMAATANGGMIEWLLVLLSMEVLVLPHAATRRDAAEISASQPHCVPPTG
jgi:hypothetical protein